MLYANISEYVQNMFKNMTIQISHKANLNKFQWLKITKNIFCDNNGFKLGNKKNTTLTIKSSAS